MGNARDSSSLDREFKGFIQIFLAEAGEDPQDFDLKAIGADGSKRNFWRVAPRESDRTFVAMANPPVEDSARRENLAYLRIGRHLTGKGLPLPRIHTFRLDAGWFVMEDFGSVRLQDAVASGEGRISVYEEVITLLLRLQIQGSEGFSPSWTCQTETYDADVMRRFEADYFRDAFLCNYLGLKKEWPELESPFTHLAGQASRAETRFFLHRDFQSRNIMVTNGRIGVLDWQGGRFGPLAYDLASLLIDPYTSLSRKEKGAIYETYVRLLAEALPDAVEDVIQTYPYLALQRNLQILGAFSFLTRVQKKPVFAAYLSPALISLRDLLEELHDEKLSPLEELVLSLDPSRLGPSTEEP